MSISTPWIKAQASGGGNQCVEMRRTEESVEVRDSKHPEGPTLRFAPDDFAAWLDGAKKGEFDQLTG
jgi:hypothetical protein